MSTNDQPQTTAVFISYRRDDPVAAAYTIPLTNSLRQAFGQASVLIDNDIGAGVDIRDHVQDALAKCSAVLVVIGDRWDALDGSNQRQMDNPADKVRIEVSRALASNIQVIPVLVQGAALPSSLPEDIDALRYRHHVRLDNASYEATVEKLMAEIRVHIAEATGASVEMPNSSAPNPVSPDAASDQTQAPESISPGQVPGPAPVAPSAAPDPTRTSEFVAPDQTSGPPHSPTLVSPRAPFTPPILDDHYTFLGLPDFASKDQINGALEDQLGIASSLDNSQPLRSQELRDRIRDIKEDLLTTEAKRADYDDALRAARRQSASVPAQAPVPPAPASGPTVGGVATLGQPPTIGEPPSPLSESPTEIWRLAQGALPLRAQETIVVQQPAGRLVALDPATGNLRWQYMSQGTASPEIAWVGGTILATWSAWGKRNRTAGFNAPEVETLFALDAASGAVRGQSAVQGSSYGIGSNGRFAFLTVNHLSSQKLTGEVHAFDLATGTVLWTYREPPPQRNLSRNHLGGAVIHGSDIIVSAAFRGLRAFDQATGALRWRADGFEGRAQTVSGGRILLAASNGNLHLLNGSTGQVMWTVGSGPQLDPIVVNDIAYYGRPIPSRLSVGAVDREAGVFSVDVNGGSIRWHMPWASGVFSNAIMHCNTLLIAGSSFLVGIDPNSGRTMWRHELFPNEQRGPVRLVLIGDILCALNAGALNAPLVAIRLP